MVPAGAGAVAAATAGSLTAVVPAAGDASGDAAGDAAGTSGSAEAAGVGAKTFSNAWAKSCKLLAAPTWLALGPNLAVMKKEKQTVDRALFVWFVPPSLYTFVFIPIQETQKKRK